jgi:hypothetical protein
MILQEFNGAIILPNNFVSIGFSFVLLCFNQMLLNMYIERPFYLLMQLFKLFMQLHSYIVRKSGPILCDYEECGLY